MIMRRTPHRRSLALAVLATTLVTAVPLTVGCDAVSKAIDCAQLAVEVSADVDNLEQAVSGGVEDPAEVETLLDTLTKDIDKLSDKTDNADVEKAVNNLQQAVDNVQTAIDQGKAPDLGPVTDAVGELTDVCSPG